LRHVVIYGDIVDAAFYAGRTSMSCPTCGKFVIFGGVKEGKQRYCCKACFDADIIPREAKLVPPLIAEKFAREIAAGRCP
jgi:endogenous inhibitor of DNA gyrase (YacG/DUF329 family)